MKTEKKIGMEQNIIIRYPGRYAWYFLLNHSVAVWLASKTIHSVLQSSVVDW